MKNTNQPNKQIEKKIEIILRKKLTEVFGLPYYSDDIRYPKIDNLVLDIMEAIK